MASVDFCLILLCLHSLMPQSITSEGRSEDVFETYVLNGGDGKPKSHLFSQCLAGAQTVEGVLYSIVVAEDEEYVRFVPQEKMDFQWTAVDLGDEPSIIDCAHKAFDQGAYMFKFDSNCNLALNSSYDPKAEQGCDGAATEVVYITSRPFTVFNGEIVPFGESRGCYFSSPEGMRYYENGILVSERPLPTPETCSPTADQGFHLVMNCVEEGMSFCEAEARCEALGLPMASKGYYDVFALGSSPYNLQINPGLVWINLRKKDGVWHWIPEMATVPDSNILPGEWLNQKPECAVLLIQDQFLDLFDTDCNNTLIDCVCCYDANSALPQC